MSLPEALKARGPTDGMRIDARRATRRAFLTALLTVPVLSACGDGGIRPLYGSVGIGANVGEKLAQVQVAPVPGRVGQRIRNELIFQSTGGGQAVPPQYRLDIAIRESVTSTLVQTNGESLGQLYTIDASFQLVRLSDNSVALTGISYGRAGFERFESIFSNVRARQNAEDRAAKTVGDELKSRLTAYLSNQA